MACVRWFEDVAQEDFVNHNLKPVRDENVLIWKRVQVPKTAGVIMMRWAVADDSGFQCSPFTTGWAVINCNSISHRVLMQPVNHASLDGFFWLNTMVYR